MSLHNKKRKITFLSSVTDNIYKSKTNIATLANFIHYLDANVMIKTVDNCIKENITVIPIHDCFYTHAKNTLKVQDIYYKTSEEFLKYNILESFIENNKESFSKENYEIAIIFSK
jgi:DNA-directed RNA polymerase